MTIQNLVILNLNIAMPDVYLLSNLAALQDFRNALPAEEVTLERSPDQQSSPSESQAGPLIIEIRRRQLSIRVYREGTLIEQEYPKEGDVPSLAHAIANSMSCSSLDETMESACSYNVGVLYEQSPKMSARQYLGNRLFPSLDLGLAGWHLHGGSGIVTFESSKGLLTLHFAPRFNDDETNRIYFDLKLEQNSQMLPDQQTIEESFRMLWSLANDIPNRLEEGDK